jgi:hypothetical protein
VNNTKKKFIGCTKWKPKEKNHRFLTIPPNVDLELLEMMFNEHSYHPHGIDFEVIVKFILKFYVNNKPINIFI